MAGPRSVVIEDLRQYFRLPEKEVAKKLGICLTSLKKVCRSNGINRWPYRKVSEAGRKNACNQTTTCVLTRAPPHLWQMKSLDKKSRCDSTLSLPPTPPGTGTSAWARGDSPDAMSLASTSLPSPEPEFAAAHPSGPVGFEGENSSAVVENPKAQSTPLEASRVHAHCESVSSCQDISGSESGRTWAADAWMLMPPSTDPPAGGSTPQEVAPSEAHAGMSDEDLIALLAGCVAVKPASAAAEGVAFGVALCEESEESVHPASVCVLEKDFLHLDEFDNPLQELGQERLWCGDDLGM